MVRRKRGGDDKDDGEGSSDEAEPLPSRAAPQARAVRTRVAARAARDAVAQLAAKEQPQPRAPAAKQRRHALAVQYNDDDDDEIDYTYCQWRSLPFPSLRERFRLVNDAYQVFNGLGMLSTSERRATVREPDHFWLEQHPEEISAIIRVHLRTHRDNQHELFKQLHKLCLTLEEHMLTRDATRAQFSGFNDYCVAIERNLLALEAEASSKSRLL